MSVFYNYPPFKTDSSGNILVSVSGTLTSTLTNTHIFVGNASNVATDVAMSGDATIANTGALTVASIGGKAVVLGGALTFSGAFSTVFTVTAGTSVTLPTSGTLTTLATVVSTANTYTAAQRGAFSTLTDASTVTPDFSLANNYNLTLGGSRTLGTPTNLVAGQSGVISVRQDITGSRTLAYSWVWMFPGGTAPTLSTGKLVLDQLNYMVNSSSTATVTMTIAGPCVVTWTAHGLVSGQRVQFSTTGALPTGLSVATTYWITVIDANTFNLSTSLANAQAATFITTTGSQSGVQTAVNASITLTANLAIA